MNMSVVPTVLPVRPDLNEAALDVPTNQVIRLKIWVNWRSVNSKIASCGFGIGSKVEFITAIWTYGLHIRSEARWANSQLKYSLNLT